MALTHRCPHASCLCAALLLAVLGISPLDESWRPGRQYSQWGCRGSPLAASGGSPAAGAVLGLARASTSIFVQNGGPQSRCSRAVRAAGALPMGEAGRQGAGAYRAAAQALRSRSRRPPAAVEAHVCRPAAGMPEKALSLASGGSAGAAVADGCGWEARVWLGGIRHRLGACKIGHGGC